VIVGRRVFLERGRWATVGRLSHDGHTRLSVVVGAVLTLADFIHLAAIPHPVWFAVLTTVPSFPARG
jgi:hypothetical protein